jgi:hypothetical protein
VRQYTHPQPDPLRLARYYRRFLIKGLKPLWMGHGRGHRCLRAHMKYLDYIDQYLAGKAAAFAVAPSQSAAPTGEGKA